jgi:hypothetical protein
MAAPATTRGAGRPDSAKPVQRFLPEAYRKGGRGTALYALTRALARALARLDRDLEAALKAHYLDQLQDLEDAARLGALLDEAPWRDETLPAFRRRLRRYAALVLAGGANAVRLLELVALATGAEVRERFGPRQAALHTLPTGTDAYADRFTVAAVLEKPLPAPDLSPTASGNTTAQPTPVPPPPAVFIARVEDQPLQDFTERVEPGPDGRLSWIVFNEAPFAPPDAFLSDAFLPDAFGQDGGAPVADHPRLTITAGAAPLAAPVLVQHEARRAVLINRVLPPGCVLELDLTDPAAPALLEHSPPDMRSMAGPVGATDAQGNAEPLYFGTAAILDLSRFAAPAGLPPHWGRWYPAAEIAPVADLAAAALAPDAPAPARLPWPPLLPLGRSGWSLLAADWCAAAGPVPIERLRFRHTAANAPAAVALHWRGRLPGTFTVRFERRWCSPAGAAALPERVQWLEARIRRLVPAGSVYLPPERLAEPCQDACGTPPAPATPSDPVVDDGPAADTGIAAGVGTDTAAAPETADPASATGRHRIDARSGLAPADALHLHRERAAAADHDEDALQAVGDGSLAGRATLALSDRIDIERIAPGNPGGLAVDEPLGLGDRLSLIRRGADGRSLTLAERLSPGDALAFDKRRRDES